MTLDVTLDSADSAMRQACMTAHNYLRAAVADIDGVMGDGYAREHPELVCAYMRTAAQDFHTTIMKVAMQDLMAETWADNAQ